jgi:menaquinone-dependent protoporphyrinogen oxidase
MRAARVDVKVLIAYGSHLGATAGIAEEIADTLRRETGASVTVEPAILGEPIDAYDAVIVGGGTYGGRWHPDSVTFVRRHAVALANRRVWFFSDGPLGPTATVRPKPPIEIKELIELVNPREHVIFAGAHDRSEIDDSELTRFEKFVAKRFVPEGDWRDWAAIEAWARGIARDLQPAPVEAG